MADLQDYYNTGDNGHQAIYGAIWLAQTFTPTGAYDITSVKLKFAFGAGGSGKVVTLGIRATDGSGLPTGADLTSATAAADTIAAINNDWYEFTLSVPYSLSSGTKYAIVLRNPDGVYPTHIINWRSDSTSPTYAGGAFISSVNSGSSWTENTALDFMFETWGTAGTVYAEGTKTVTAAGTASLASETTGNDEGTLTVTVAGVVSLSTEQLALTEGTLTVTAAASVSLDTESYKSNSTFPSARPSDYDGDLYWHESTGTWTSTRTQIAGAWVQSVVVVSEEGEIYFRSI